jgi:4-hydroxybenzoate polyprenyltransferase
MFAPGLNHLIRLLRWDKPTGRLILLVPALWSLVWQVGDVHPGICWLWWCWGQ